MSAMGRPSAAQPSLSGPDNSGPFTTGPAAAITTTVQSWLSPSPPLLQSATQEDPYIEVRATEVPPPSSTSPLDALETMLPGALDEPHPLNPHKYHNKEAGEKREEPMDEGEDAAAAIAAKFPSPGEEYEALDTKIREGLGLPSKEDSVAALVAKPLSPGEEWEKLEKMLWDVVKPPRALDEPHPLNPDKYHDKEGDEKRKRHEYDPEEALVAMNTPPTPESYERMYSFVARVTDDAAELKRVLWAYLNGGGNQEDYDKELVVEVDAISPDAYKALYTYLIATVPEVSKREAVLWAILRGLRPDGLPAAKREEPNGEGEDAAAAAAAAAAADDDKARGPRKARGVRQGRRAAWLAALRRDAMPDAEPAVPQRGRPYKCRMCPVLPDDK